MKPWFCTLTMVLHPTATSLLKTTSAARSTTFRCCDEVDVGAVDKGLRLLVVLPN
jgi:hypothetical protein